MRTTASVTLAAVDRVPVVDLGASNVVDTVRDACERLGFLMIVGHEVDPRLVQATWDAARSFFEMPIADRMRVAMPTPGYPYGYSPVAGESLAASLGQQGHPDLKESFAIGPVDPPSHSMCDPDEASAWSPNLWPTEVASFRATWELYYREMAALSARVLSVFAQALDLSSDYFEPMIDRHTSAMRAINYPASSSVLPGQLGAGAHTDYGTLTVLLADPSQGGLQVRSTTGSWIDVVPAPGSFVVNLGDAMARWTNDRWRSTLHRVVVPSVRRQSIAFFHNANWDAVIEALPTCLPAGESARYEPITAGPHLMSKFRATTNAM